MRARGEALRYRTRALWRADCLLACFDGDENEVREHQPKKILHVPVVADGVAVIEHPEPPHAAAKVQFGEHLPAADGRRRQQPDVVVVAAGDEQIVGEREDRGYACLVGFAVGPERGGGRVGVGKGELSCLDDGVVATGEEQGGVRGEGEGPGFESVGCYLGCGGFAGGVPGLGDGCTLADRDGAVGEGHCYRVWLGWVPEQVQDESTGISDLMFTCVLQFFGLCVDCEEFQRSSRCCYA